MNIHQNFRTVVNETDLLSSSSSMIYPQITFDNLNLWYSFHDAYNVDNGVPHGDYIRYPNYIVVTQLVLRQLISKFEIWNLNDIVCLCRLHNIVCRGRNKPKLLLLLLRHDCVHEHCTSVNYVFKSKSRPTRSRGFGSRTTAFSRSESDLTQEIDIATANNMTTSYRVRNAFSSAQVFAETDLHANEHVTTTHDNGIYHTANESISEDFPKLRGKSFRNGVIREWQEAMHPDNWKPVVCCICGQDKRINDIRDIDFTDEQLKVLMNDNIPQHTLPNSYNLIAYNNAILHPKGLTNGDARATAKVCRLCYSSIRTNKQPLNALANFQYYGWERLPEDVRDAFMHATLFDLMLVSRARCSRITHLFSSNKQSPAYGSNPQSSQRYNRGNVAIFPQDSAQLLDFLPPNRNDIEQDMCALFIGGTTVPTKDNVKYLNPVLVSKNRVYTMIKFLTENNEWYKRSGTIFSEDNFRSLFEDGDIVDEIVAPGMEINHLTTPQTNEELPTHDYSNRSNVDQSINEESPLLMEAVGYTNVNGSSTDYQNMKNNALAWCLNNRPFVAARNSSTFLRDDDPGFLAYAFPHLDPWGIGGFNNPLNTPKKRLPFERQLRNLLLQHKSPFEDDANFAFVCWNIIQKSDIRRRSCFSMKKNTSRNIAEQMRLLSPIFERLADKWERDVFAHPEGDEERAAINLLNNLKMVNRDLKGSLGYKLSRRNEVRALIKKFSTPALFITLNPHDISHPLLGVIGGFSILEWQTMTAFQRSCFVAKHPAVAAKFFDAMINSFVSIVLKPGHNDGYFGKCKAYYGMVEAQGRGTLHCHMLIWLDGNPSPKELREKLRTDAEFKHALFSWLELNICSHLPGTLDEELVMDHAELERADLPSPDPRTLSQPCIADFESEDEFELAFQSFVKDLVLTCNWHEHTHTCWKHLKNDEPHDDAHCRMRINGQTRSLTEIDPETESILLRRLHPRINNFNELVIFLMQCNMDIKYIGSGEAAKALVYYITDYITKQDMPTHVGFSALRYALQRTSREFWSTSDQDTAKIDRSVIIKSINALNARQEMSHQQVMSYLVGGGDFYTSHWFQTLKWMDFVRHVIKEASLQNEPHALGNNHDTDFNDGDDHSITVTVESGQVMTSTNLLDYVHRSDEDPFHNMSLWEFYEQTKLEPINPNHSQNGNASGQRGRPSSIRGRLSVLHPKSDTHQIRIRKTFVVPVLIGPSLPRPDRGDQEYEEWCRLMLVLFKPWRTVADLISINQPWVDSFSSCQFKEEHMYIMKNMNVENECKDARDSHRATRILSENSNPVNPTVSAHPDTGTLEDFILADNELSFLHENIINAVEHNQPDVQSNGRTTREITELVKNLDSIGLFTQTPVMYTNNRQLDVVYASFSVEQLRTQAKLMAQLKSHKRLRGDDDEQDHLLNANDISEVNFRQLSSDMSIGNNSLVQVEQLRVARCMYTHVHNEQICANLTNLDQIIDDRGLRNNVEQLRAFQIVGQHMITQDSNQLLLYVSGVGGTGKSYVIKCISTLFDNLRKSDELLISAPTGSAAVLINGFTIHSILQLVRRGKADTSVLERILKRVRYLIVDEVSMISAITMHQISLRLQEAFAYDPSRKELPFGGMNMIFFGDMGQLPPVRNPSVFSERLVSKISVNTIESNQGQNGVSGAVCWRRIHRVVELKKNWRAHKDPRYVNLLMRVRSGIAWDGLQAMTEEQKGVGENYEKSDYMTIYDRLLTRLEEKSNRNVNFFADAPIIVATRKLRDALNSVKVEQFATQTGQNISYYCSRDSYKQKSVSDNVRLRDWLWRLDSSVTGDALSKLPLVPGMKVMITENIATSEKVVNGAEGILQYVRYDEVEGVRYATCAYVLIEGSNIQVPGLPIGIVPILPVNTSFKYTSSDNTNSYTFRRTQLPIVPAYAFTDYKSQGRTLAKAIIDIAGCLTLQSLYVMLSRVGSLEDVAVLRFFPQSKIYTRLSLAFRNEFERLRRIEEHTSEVCL